MILLERDGITVQALSDREAAEYQKLGYKKVEQPAPAEKADKRKPAAEKAKAEKDGE